MMNRATARAVPRDEMPAVSLPPFSGSRLDTTPHPNAPLHGRRGAGRVVAGAGLLMAVEGVLPTLLLTLVIVTTTLGLLPRGLNSFLSLRVTVKNVLLCLAYIGVSIALFRSFGAYQMQAVRARLGELTRVTLAASCCAALAAVFPLTSVNGGVQWRHLGYLWVGLVMAECGLRIARRVVASRHREPWRVIVAGAGPRAVATWYEFSADDSVAWELVGFVDVRHGPWVAREVHGRIVGTLEDLERMLMTQAIDEVFIALPVKSLYRECQHIISLCERLGVRARYRSDVFATRLAWPRAERGHHAVVTMHVVPDDYRLILKRVVDVVGALTVLVLVSPVMVATAVAITLTSRGPVLFSQDRLGLNRRTFKMLKFRSMVVDAAALQATLEARNEADGILFKITHDPRVTRVGRFIRRTSIDELPQLFNVLQGEMSLVGPRPLALRDAARIRRSSDIRRFSVKPGCTGLWQISGRSQLGYGDWIRLDLLYIDSWTFVGDLRILIGTIPAVLRGTGAV